MSSAAGFLYDFDPEFKRQPKRLRWQSPVQETINPAHMNLTARGGLGWLEGFNEFMCRCGMENIGQPGKDEIVTNTGAKAEVLHVGYVEFQHSPCQGLAITATGTTKAYGDGVLDAGANRSLVLDFEVEDVDAHYWRLKDVVDRWVIAPTTMPWGNRAMLFRDPDGNLVNFFSQRQRTAT